MRISFALLAALLSLAASSVFAQTFSNAANIDLPAGQPGTTSGPGGPSPSNITVSGVGATVASVTVTLTNYSHTFPNDIDVLLVGPTGVSCIIMSDVGGTGAVTGLNLTFDQAAAGTINTTTVASGTFQPSNSGTGDTWTGAPAGPYGATLSGFAGTTADGTWALYTQDDVGGDVGTIAGGWSITITPNTPQPEMDVVNGATPVADGGTDPLGNIGITAQQSVTYTIENTGAAALTLTGTPVVVVTSGTNTQGVAVVTQPAGTVGATSSVQFTVNYTVQAAGAFDFTVSIDNDDSDENPYNWTVSGMGVAAPEINVQRGSTTIISGGTDAIGNRTFNQNSNLTYTVQNLGTATLNITSITISGEINVTATVTSGLTSVAAAANDTFTIQLNPTAAGAFSFQITIANDDGDEGTYTINVTGTGVKKKKKSSGDDEGCSTNGGSSSWLALVGLLGVLALATRLRASRE